MDDGLVLVRVRRPDGGQEDVTLEAAELEEALAAASGHSAELVTGRAAGNHGSEQGVLRPAASPIRVISPTTA